MNCVLCGPLKWLGKIIGGDCQSYQASVRQKLHSWRYAQTNDQTVYQHDPELDVLQCAETLAKDDPEAALLQLCALAERGSVWRMLLVGWAYQTGKGVAADHTQAEHWYRIAFEGGCQRAQLYLGHIYTKRREFDRCEKVYDVGANDHWAPAMYHLAWTKLRQPKTPQRLEEARILLEQAAALGDLGAQMDLAHFLMRGRYGMRRIPGGFLLAFDAARKAVAFVEQDAPVTGRPQVAEVPTPSVQVAHGDA
jgi:TPR repeat protein